MNYIRNEQGNMTIFIIGIMSIMLLMFLLVGSFASVFTSKEKASNIAEQASLVASSILKDEIENAINDYEIIVSNPLVLYPSIREIIERRVSQSHSTLTKKELRRQVTNDVLREQLPTNGLLSRYIENAVSIAKRKIPAAVENNIHKNEGIVPGTVISISETNRIKVTTHVRYKAMKYDEYFTEEDRKVVQSGEGPPFDFLKIMGNRGTIYHEFGESSDLTLR